jgi:hypothetical protein
MKMYELLLCDYFYFRFRHLAKYTQLVSTMLYLQKILPEIRARALFLQSLEGFVLTFILLKYWMF